jgi:tetratricopeptide (TPR) repeat protein
LQPNNEKALYRKAKCLEERGQVEESIGILRRITRLYPDNKTSKADLTRSVYRTFLIKQNFQVQWEPVFVITLGQKRLITLTK